MIRKCRDFLRLLAPQFKLERVIFLSCKDMTLKMSYTGLSNTQTEPYKRTWYGMFTCCICSELTGEFSKNDKKMSWLFTTSGATIQTREGNFLELWWYELYNFWFICLFGHLQWKISVFLIAFAQTWQRNFKRIVRKCFSFCNFWHRNSNKRVISCMFFDLGLFQGLRPY